MTVALVLVSHSADIANGTAQIASQMAPDVLILPAGGTPEHLGTNVDLVLTAVRHALATTATAPDGGGVVVLTDLGSATMTAETVVELLDPADANRVRLPSAPFVEGAVVAAVRAQQGGGLDDVAADAHEAAVRLAARP